MHYLNPSLLIIYIYVKEFALSLIIYIYISSRVCFLFMSLRSFSNSSFFLHILNVLLTLLYLYISCRKAYRCSREDDITTCCFGDVLSDKKPTPFNLKDIYQQFQIHRHHGGGFFAQAVAPDGVPPKFLRTKGWKMRSSSSLHLPYEEALGLDSSRRQLLPDFDFPIFTTRSPPVVVGKW